MNTVIMFLIYSLAILAISMVGAYLPRMRTLSDRQIHLLVSLSTGIFIGLLFLMLLPEAFEQVFHVAFHEAEEAGMTGHEAFEHALGSLHPVLYAILAGFLLILTIETWMKNHHMAGCSCGCNSDTHSHKLTSLSSFAGLSIHAACDGLALAATFLAGEDIAILTTLGMCIHKFVVLFSLSSMTLVSDIPKKKSMKYLLLFGLITPISGLLFFGVLSGIDGWHDFTGIPLAFAAGTFMYVALCDMLPEAFHRRDQNTRSIILLFVGIALIFLMTILFPHTH